MTPDRSGEILEAFHEARGLSPDERREYFERRWKHERELVHEVEELIAAEPAEEVSPLDDGVGSKLLGPASARALLAPEWIGPYRILETLGEGGMGIVYLAEQEVPLRRTVAIKVLRPDLLAPALLSRFENERQLLVRLDHPSIARVLDAGTTEDRRPYFALELVSGLPLTKHCSRNGLGLRERLDLFIQVCEAVQHAHEKGVVHRDLKPSNVLVSYKDGHARPKVIDFGVAKALYGQGRGPSAVTLSGQMIGTPEYMAPEQADSAGGDVDTRSDVYALGALLYELLTGKLPFDGEDLRQKRWSEVVTLLLTKVPVRPSAVLPSEAAPRGSDVQRALELDLDWVVLKCLEKERSRRYASADALADDLRRFLTDQPVSAGPPSKRYLAGKFVRRHRSAVRSVAAVFLVLVGGLVATTWQARRAEGERRRAEQEAASQRLILGVLTDLLATVDPYRPRALAPLTQEITVADVFDSMNEEVGRRFADSPFEEATIRHTLGLGFLELGENDQALDNLERSLELRERFFPDDDRSVGLARAALGYGGYLVRGPRAALPLLEEGLASLRAVDPEARDTLQAERWLVAATRGTPRGHELATRRYEIVRRIYGEKSHEGIQALLDVTATQLPFDFDQAQRDYARLEALVEEYYGSPDHPEAVMLRRSYAITLGEVGRQFEALPIFEDVVAALEKGAFRHATWRITSALHLAITRSQTGDIQGALELSEDCLRRALELSPVDSSITLNVFVGHARCLLDAGESAKSEELLREAQRLCPETLAADTGLRAYTERMLARALLALDRVDEAEALLQSGLTAVKADPACWSSVTVAYLELVNFYLDVERLDSSMHYAEEAAAFLEEQGAVTGFFMVERALIQALVQRGEFTVARGRLTRLLERSGSSPHDDLAPTLHLFADLAYREGSHAEAARHLEGAKRIYEESFGPDHDLMLLIQQQIASVHAELGDHEEAIRVLREVEATCRDLAARDNDGAAFVLHGALSKKGRLLVAQGELDEAESDLTECLPHLRRRYGDTSERATVVVDALEDIYERTGRPEELAALRARIADD